MPRRDIGEVKAELHSFLTLAMDGGEWLTWRLGHLVPGKEPRYPMNRGLGGPQSRPGRYREEKNLLFLFKKERHPLNWKRAIPTSCRFPQTYFQIITNIFPKPGQYRYPSFRSCMSYTTVTSAKLAERFKTTETVHCIVSIAPVLLNFTLQSQVWAVRTITNTRIFSTGA